MSMTVPVRRAFSMAQAIRWLSTLREIELLESAVSSRRLALKSKSSNFASVEYAFKGDARKSVLFFVVICFVLSYNIFGRVFVIRGCSLLLSTTGKQTCQH